MHIFELCDVAFQHYSLLKLMISSNQSVLFFKILVLFTMIQVCGYRGSSLPHFLTLLLFPPVTQYYSQKEISLLSFFLILIQHERMRDALGIKEATLISCLKKNEDYVHIERTRWQVCIKKKLYAHILVNLKTFLMQTCHSKPH